MKLGCIVYHHQHGVDVLPFQMPDDSDHPEITNELLKTLGVDNPELGDPENLYDGEEYAEWHYLPPTHHWPTIHAMERQNHG